MSRGISYSRRFKRTAGVRVRGSFTRNSAEKLEPMVPKPLSDFPSLMALEARLGRIKLGVRA